MERGCSRGREEVMLGSRVEFRRGNRGLGEVFPESGSRIGQASAGGRVARGGLRNQDGRRQAPSTGRASPSGRRRVTRRSSGRSSIRGGW